MPDKALYDLLDQWSQANLYYRSIFWISDKIGFYPTSLVAYTLFLLFALKLLMISIFTYVNTFKRFSSKTTTEISQ